MELEIKVMWCKGLTAFNFFQKLSIYAAVSLTSEDERIQLTPDQKQEQKTPVDEDNEGSPEWNYPMKFDLQSLDFVDPVFDDLSLLFEFRINGQLFGDKTIGEVRVPLKDLIQSASGEIDRFVSYEVRNPEGKHNGIFDFAYKVIGDANTRVTSSNDVSITGYQHHDHHQQKLDQSHDNCTDIDVNVNGYYHHHLHHQQQFDSHTESKNSEIHMTGYHHHHHHHHHHSNGSALLSETERIQYPSIEFGDNHSSMVSAPPLVYPPASSISSLTATAAAQYQLSAPDIYPPPAPPQTWAPPPPAQPHYPPPSHYPPPPPPRPYVYPPPVSQPQLYGNTHWGHHRPPGYHHHW